MPVPSTFPKTVNPPLVGYRDSAGGPPLVFQIDEPLRGGAIWIAFHFRHRNRAAFI